MNTEIEKSFIPYGMAVKLKELGFYEPCWKYFYIDGKSKNTGLDKAMDRNIYDNQYNRPLYDQVKNWLNNNHNIKLIEIPNFIDKNTVKWIWSINSKITGLQIHPAYLNDLNEAIETALTLIK